MTYSRILAIMQLCSSRLPLAAWGAETPGFDPVPTGAQGPYGLPVSE